MISEVNDQTFSYDTTPLSKLTKSLSVTRASFCYGCNRNKKLSYRRETALQGAL